MSNPLYDALIQPQAARDDCLLLLDGGGQVTGRQFVNRVHQFAHALQELGLKPGDRLAVQIEKSAEALALYGASLAVGIVFLPLNTAYTVAEVSYFVEDSGAALLVCDPKKEEGLKPVALAADAKLITLDAKGQGSLADLADAQSTNFKAVSREPDDLAAILYTSGTTGRSKGAMLTHFNLLENAKVLMQEWRFTPDDTLLHMLPIFHTHGLFVASNVSLLSGGKMVFLSGFKVEQALEWLPKVTTMMGVPTFYTRLLDEPKFDKAMASHMRLFTSGSAPLLAETHHSFEERTGHRILERYGMTETNMSTSNPYDGERRAGTVGFPLPGIEIIITDPETGIVVPQGETGMIEVKGHNVFKGYWQMPEKTREELRDNGFFITGDMGLIDKDGYVTIVGRQKDLVISGGYNIYPKEIELILDEQDGVLESAVFGVPHKDFGEAVYAAIVPRSGAKIDVANLEKAMGDQLARFKQPKGYVVLDELPRNTMGKVQKNLLRDKFKDAFM